MTYVGAIHPCRNIGTGRHFGTKFWSRKIAVVPAVYDPRPLGPGFSGRQRLKPAEGKAAQGTTEVVP